MASVPIAEISRQDLQHLPGPPSSTACITNVEHLSSYNWIEAPMPTIAVPGCPSLWAPPSGSQEVQKDQGFRYIAQNAARHPDSPLEPQFRALHITSPDFDLGSVDIVCARNVIRKLLSFVDPASTMRGLEAFTIGIETVKNTVILSTQNAKTHEFIGPNNFVGHGHEFEKAYTRNQIENSTGHHRIITYCFGGLKFLVRHETDAFVAAGTTSPFEPARDGTSSSLNIATAPAGSKLTIYEHGKTVPIASTLEIKTRVAHKPIEIQTVAAQLWASQTPKLVRAYHNWGKFMLPDVEEVADAVAQWEKDNREHLTKLAAIMNRIVSVARELGGSVIMEFDCRGDKLVLCKGTEKKMLPEDVYSHWD